MIETSMFTPGKSTSLLAFFCTKYNVDFSFLFGEVHFNTVLFENELLSAIGSSTQVKKAEGRHIIVRVYNHKMPSRI